FSPNKELPIPPAQPAKIDLETKNPDSPEHHRTRSILRWTSFGLKRPAFYTLGVKQGEGESDPRIAYLADSKARMATQGYGKVRSGQVIGSGLGVSFDRWVFR